jgi:hypothetical protein
MMVTWDEWAKHVNEKLTDLSNRIDHIARHMALDTQILALRTDFNILRDELTRDIYLEKMQVHIVESLRSKAKTQQEIAKSLPNFTNNPMVFHAFYNAWEQLEKAGVILPISRGRGHPRWWQLSLSPSDDLLSKREHPEKQNDFPQIARKGAES